MPRKREKSVIPDSFWYWSIAGSVIMCIYWT
ncbi:MAG: lipid-A-disaccharide synthase N-terminal domain-containing protein [Planctomycetia bacterium]|nr:lipid-A-disaccharide synthase N-terminal domain-containing protein [Planctomycetia bacterium]